MSYVPSYLEFLSRSGTVDGWPKGIDDEGKLFATDKVRAGLEKYGQVSLDLAKRCIYDQHIDNTPVPECLRGVVWDWLYAVTYRALQAVHTQQVFVAEANHAKKKKNVKSWYPVPVSRADVEALVTAGTVTVGVTGERVRALAALLEQTIQNERPSWPIITQLLQRRAK